jgi:putative heme transporter
MIPAVEDEGEEESGNRSGSERAAPELSRPKPSLHVDLVSTLWLTVAVVTAFALFGIFRNAGRALTQIAIGVILALALDPLVARVCHRLDAKKPRANNRAHAVAFVAGTFMTLGVMVVLLVGPAATREAQQFGRQLPATLKQFESLPVVGAPLRKYDVKQKVDEFVARLPAKFDAGSMQAAAARLFSNVLSFVVVTAIVIGALLDGPRLLALIRSLFFRHPEMLDRVDRIGRIMSMTLGQYFGGSLTVAAMMGLFVLIVGLVLGVPLAPLAALWAAFTDLIPQVGGLLGGGFLVLLALTKGPVTAMIAGAVFLIYMNLENHLIAPAVVGESIGLSPVSTMLAAFIGGAIAGLPGTLIATPLVGVAKRLYVESRTGEKTAPKRHRSLFDRVKTLLHRFSR